MQEGRDFHIFYTRVEEKVKSLKGAKGRKALRGPAPLRGQGGTSEFRNGFASKRIREQAAFAISERLMGRLAG
jgi:hypothetical protein